MVDVVFSEKRQGTADGAFLAFSACHRRVQLGDALLQARKNISSRDEPQTPPLELEDTRGVSSCSLCWRVHLTTHSSATEIESMRNTQELTPGGGCMLRPREVNCLGYGLLAKGKMRKETRCYCRMLPAAEY